MALLAFVGPEVRLFLKEVPMIGAIARCLFLLTVGLMALVGTVVTAGVAALCTGYLSRETAMEYVDVVVAKSVLISAWFGGISALATIKKVIPYACQWAWEKIRSSEKVRDLLQDIATSPRS